MRPGLSSNKRALLGRRRLLRIMIMALNFIYCDFSFEPLELLQRRPNRSRARCLSYHEALLRTYGSGQEDVVPSATGRRMNVLQARLSESTHMTQLGVPGDAYHWSLAGQVVAPDTVDEALRPYRPLDASRLKISGKANWDPSPWLTPDLWLAFVEPRSLSLLVQPPIPAHADCRREDPEQTLRGPSVSLPSTTK